KERIDALLASTMHGQPAPPSRSRRVDAVAAAQAAQRGGRSVQNIQDRSRKKQTAAEAAVGPGAEGGNFRGNPAYARTNPF
uniref:hypothetical protein n=1 Tax=Xanthomonas campestris pv. translucens TaxID=343 RepID=UPI001E3BF847